MGPRHCAIVSTPRQYRPRRRPASKRLSGTITRPHMQAVLLARIADNLHGDLAEAVVRVGGRMVSDGVRVTHILADILERLHLLLPGARKIGLAAGALRNSAEHAG